MAEDVRARRAANSGPLESNVCDCALAFEGGGYRAAYTAGLVVLLLEQGIYFDYVCGISAGASHTLNYVSRDIPRATLAFMGIDGTEKLGGLGTLVRGKGYFNASYTYEGCLFAGFFLGPLAGFGVVVIKLLLKIAIQGSETAFVGEFSNLVSSTLFVVLAAWIYKVDRTKKGAVIAMAASTVAVSILAIFLNAYIMFPLYSRLYGMPMEAIIGMGTAINPRINSLITMMLFSILPFNLVKHLVTSLITFLVYKRAGNVLRGILYN